MVKVGDGLFCTFMAGDLDDSKYLIEKLTMLANSIKLYYTFNSSVKPHPSTTEHCYAFRGLVEPKDVFVFPSEGNILCYSRIGDKSKIHFTDDSRTLLSLEGITFRLFRNHLSTPEISEEKFPGFYKK